MTRSEAGKCDKTLNGQHRWIEVTTKDTRGEEFICHACSKRAIEPFRP